MVVRFASSLFLAISVLLSVLLSNCNMIVLREQILQIEDSESTPTEENTDIMIPYDERIIIETIDESDPPVEVETVESDCLVIPIEEIEAIARTLYGECRGVPSMMEKAAVAWVILNRVDAGFGGTVLDVVSAEGQFAGYDPIYPVLPELFDIAEDVLRRWYMEKSGSTDVGRILPAEYLWFHGDGEHNYFRDAFRGGNVWYWSLWNPYEN